MVREGFAQARRKTAAFMTGAIALLLGCLISGTSDAGQKGPIMCWAGPPTKPLVLRAENIGCEPVSKRIIVKGNVRFDFEGYILTADSLEYDAKAKTLDAIGNVRIIYPEGGKIGAAWLRMPRAVRESFVRTFEVLSVGGTVNKLKLGRDSNCYPTILEPEIFEQKKQKRISTCK